MIICFAVHIVFFPEEQATLHDESVANRVKHAVPCYHAGGTLLAVGTTCLVHAHKVWRISLTPSS